METLKPLTFPEFHQAEKVTKHKRCAVDFSHLVVIQLGDDWGVWCNECEEYGYKHNLVGKRAAEKVQAQRRRAENELFPIEQSAEQSLAELGF